MKNVEKLFKKPKR